MRIGMACGSNDILMLPFFNKLKDQGLLEFLELHVKPDMTIRQVQRWRDSGLVEFLHPENGGRANFVQEYMDIVSDVIMISAWDKVIFDPGIEGDNYKTHDHAFKNLCDAIPIPENMPYKTSFGDTCVNYMPSQMPTIFTFDVSHAWITAFQLGIDSRKLVKDFIDLSPYHFHVTDCKGELDHLILGTGTIDWSYVIPLLPESATITIETDNVLSNRKENIEKDLKFFRRLCESYRPS